MNTPMRGTSEVDGLPSDGSPFVVPPTPFLRKVGYGTGVSVYRMDRSPRSGCERSPWALKKVNRNRVRGSFAEERLHKEADILKKLSHPNIVGFRGFINTEDGREVLVMEECTQSLGDLIEYFGKAGLGAMTPKLVFCIVEGVANALEYLHTECKLIHGDIKSYNVLIKGNFDSVKLCDFGVSIPIETEDGSSTKEYTGSLPWCPLEALKEGPITAKADIFALGHTIFEMLALHTPHFVDNELDSTVDSEELSMEEEELYGSRAPLPASLGPEYSTVISLYNWCTQEDYRRRPTAKQIIDFIQQTIKDSPTQSHIVSS